MRTQLALVLLALAIANPASAQFGGLRKKINQQVTNQEQTANPDPAATGGTVVLTSDVVAKLITGLNAGRKTREAAAKEDTPYGRFNQDELAYVAAQKKCQAAQQNLARRGADSKVLDKMNELNQKMLEAQAKRDYQRMQIYQDSSLALTDPSCAVHKPERPKDYYEAERAIERRSDSAAIKASGLSPGEYAMAQERAMMILRDGAPTDASSSEKAAVMSKKSELTLLLWPEQPGATTAEAEPGPSPQPTPAAAPAPDPKAVAAANEMSACVTKNMQAHQKELEALSKRAQAAQKAGDQAKLMALADTLQRIQMAGCMAR